MLARVDGNGLATDSISHHARAGARSHLDAVKQRDLEGKERVACADQQAGEEPARQRAPVARQRVHVEAANEGAVAGWLTLMRTSRCVRVGVDE